MMLNIRLLDRISIPFLHNQEAKRDLFGHKFYYTQVRHYIKCSGS